MVKVIVSGGRTFSNRALLFGRLDELHRDEGISLLIEGGATGADELGREWAILNDVPHVTEPADWDSYKMNPAARNTLMLDKHSPDVVVATEGGKGTANMIIQAMRRKVRVIRAWSI